MGLWEERGGYLAPAADANLVRRGFATRKLNKAPALPAAHDGCYSLKTRLVLMMVALINQELTNTQPVPREEFTASA